MRRFKLLRARPRGLCAGVDRAIDVVIAALELAGPPVYVRREIVHNRHVLDALRERGAVFVAEVEDAPRGATFVLSAHGVAPAIYARARARGMRVIDATCPLVTKVHLEALRFAREGRPIILIGHRTHEEVAGTSGYAPEQVQVVSSAAEAELVEIGPGVAPAVITQTTLSVDDARDIIEVLRRRFPGLITPARDDICYATQNRQAAVAAIARRAEVVLVVGSANSSNSNRLREVAEAAGARAFLIEDAAHVDPEWIAGARCIGLTAGASTPEHLVDEIVDLLRTDADVEIKTVEVASEDVKFAPPAALARLASARCMAAPGAEARSGFVQAAS
jgi:4-hydroxy-3-methylbut-2-enyl diphosphate reductase